MIIKLSGGSGVAIIGIGIALYGAARHVLGGGSHRRLVRIMDHWTALGDDQRERAIELERALDDGQRRRRVECDARARYRQRWGAA